MPASRAPRPRKDPAPRLGSSIIDGFGLSLVALAAVLLPLAIDLNAGLPFTVPKAVSLQILGYMLLMTIVARLVVSGTGAWPSHLLHFFVLAFLTVSVVATFLAQDRTLAVWGAYDRRLGLSALLPLVVLYAAAAVFVRRGRDAAVVAVAAGVASVVVFAYALVQWMGLDPVRWSEANFRSFSTLGNPVMMGTYAATVFAASVAAVFGLRAWERPRLGLLIAAIAVGGFAGVLLSGSRSALLGAAVGPVIGAFPWFWSEMRERDRRSLLAFGTITFAVLALAVAGAILTPLGSRLLSLLRGDDPSLIDRAYIYRAVLDVARAQPLFGAGPDSLPAVYLRFRAPESALLPAAGPFVNQSSAHGWPWKLLVDVGALGLLTYVTTVAAAGIAVVRRMSDRSAWVHPLLLGGLATFLVANAFTPNDMGTEWIIWLGLGMVVGLSASQREIRTRGSAEAQRRLWLLGIVTLVGVLAIGLSGVNEIAASRSLKISKDASARDKSLAVHFARDAAIRDGRWFVHWANLTVRAQEIGDLMQSLHAAERGTRVAPYEGLAWLNLATVQSQIARRGRGREAEEMVRHAKENVERATAADPWNPEIHAAVARLLLVMRDFPSALREAEVAARLAPAVPAYRDLVDSARRAAERREEP